MVSYPQVSPPKTRIRLSSPHTRYMPRPSRYMQYMYYILVFSLNLCLAFVTQF